MTLHRSPPHGFLRVLLRLPLWIYRCHLGWLLGHRFLLLTHRGRRTHRLHHTVLEVVRFLPLTRQFVVASGFGSQSDWYRNIQRDPIVDVQSGRLRAVMQATILSGTAAMDELRHYQHSHPRDFRMLSRLLLGHTSADAQAEVEALARSMPLIQFTPHAT